MTVIDSPYAINPMVEYLNSLRTQQQETSATYVHEARGGFVRNLRAISPWFPDESRLHVTTRLDDLANDLSSGKVQLRILFLTGDAGDGKTAFCALLARKLNHIADLDPDTEIGRFVLVKDASEIDEKDLRQRILSHLEERSPTTLVVAINEGRLRRAFRGLEDSKSRALWSQVVAPALESWAEGESIETINSNLTAWRVMVINFRHRYHVRAVAPALLKLWTESSQWEASPACMACPRHSTCPIRENAVDLRITSVQEKVADVLAWSHFSGQRLPFRRLQAVLALAITGGLCCRDLQGDSPAPSPAIDLLRHRFYSGLFLRQEIRLPIRVRPEPIAQTFARADLGQHVDPERDEQLYRLVMGSPGRDEDLESRIGSVERAALGELRQGLDPGAGTDVKAARNDTARSIRFLRQLSQFKSSDNHRPTWRRALHLLEDEALGVDSSRSLTNAVVEAINRLHRVDEVKQQTITGNQIDPAGLRVPSRQVLELNLGTEFEVDIECGPSTPNFIRPYMETVPSEIYLVAWPAGTKGTGGRARLRLDARLLDILLGVIDGYSSWQGLGAFRRDLSRFHGHLITLAAQAGLKPAITIRAGDQRYGVGADRTNGRPTLRFEGRG